MLQKKLSQQQKTIQYIRNKYKQKTGEEIVLPKKWEDYLLMDQDEVPLEQLPKVEGGSRKGRNKEIKYENYQEKFNAYQLPSRISYTKVPFTNFSAANPFHMVETIELDNFKDSGFTKVGFRQLLNRIVQMRCLKAISLSNNGIDDTCAQQIETLFGMKRVSRINVSKNEMTKTCLQIIVKNFNHLEWIDISNNYWMSQYMTLSNLINSIRTNTKLFHISLDLQDQRLVKQLANYLKIKVNINSSFSLIGSKYDNQSMTSIANVLEPMQGKKENPNRIFNLNFTYCYLDPQPFSILLKALSNNFSLISLNLSKNQLMQARAISLLSVIESHLSLTHLNLSNNELQDKFAVRLAQCLIKNQILQEILIERNNIGDQGAKQLYKTLSEHNQTLQDFGKLQTNQRISVEYIQKISKALRINKISKEIRSQLSNLQGELSAAEIANKQTQAFLQAQYQQYQLLEPIAITNPLRDDPYRINLWQFD